MLRIVIDTNVVIAALFHGDNHARELLRLVRTKQVRLVISEAIAEEMLVTAIAHAVAANLGLKHIRPAARKLLDILQSGEFINVTTHYTGCKDPDDNKFFECAIDGGADYVVSYDPDVQAVTSFSVVSPWQLIRLLRTV